MNDKILESCITKVKETLDTKHKYKNYIHFTFIVQNNKVLGFDINKPASPIRGYPNYSNRHSESEAYGKFKGILERNKPFEAVNIRINRKGDLRLSKPCKCCFSFLSKLNCKSIYYTDENGEFVKITF